MPGARAEIGVPFAYDRSAMFRNYSFSATFPASIPSFLCLFAALWFKCFSFLGC